MPLLANRRRSRLNRAHPLARGMSDCFVFDENAVARAANLASPGFPAVPNGALSSAVTAGGVAIDVPGGDAASTNYLSSADHGNTAAGDFAVRVRFVPTAYPNSSFNNLFYKVTSGAGELALYLNNTGGISATRIGGTTNTAGPYGGSFATGKVHDLIMSRSGTTLSFYQNGVLVGTDTNAGTTAQAGSPLLIGNAAADGNGAVTGKYITFQLWKRALSLTEALQLYLDPYCFLASDLPPFGAVATAAGGSTLVAATGTYTLTGEIAGLNPALVSASGSFALTGEPQILTPAIVAGAGTFALTGEPATLSAALVGAAGAYSLVGEAATGSFTGSQTLVAQVGVFTLLGEPIIGGASQILIAGTGIFSISGKLASLGVPAATGVFNLSGLRIWDNSDHFSTWIQGATPLTRWTTKRDLN